MSRHPEFGNSGQPQPADPVAQAAAEWVVRRDRGLTPGEVATLAEWLDADPRHAAEYLRISRGWQELDIIGAEPGLAAMADAVEANARARRARRTVWAAAGGLAAAAAIAVALALWQIPRAVPPDGPAESATTSYTVLASTARRIALPDGSVAELNGDSRIEAGFTPAERRVRLVRGEAHFSVAKDPAHPFIVSAGSVSVRAVGTAFDVRLAADRVEVLVTEGKVHVAESAHAPELRSGPEGSSGKASAERALISGERAVVRMAATAKVSLTVDVPSQKEIDQALAWEGTRLVFDRTPLDQVVAAFNHYNARQLVLANPALCNRTLSGVFRADNLDGFIHLLHASLDVIADPQDDNRTVLRAAP